MLFCQEVGGRLGANLDLQEKFRARVRELGSERALLISLDGSGGPLVERTMRAALTRIQGSAILHRGLDMPLWVVIFMVVIGAMFALKLLYVLSTGGMLPVTQGALFVTTAAPRIQALLDALPMGPNDRLYDLGCGDGRVLRAAGKRYGVQAVGFEVNPVAYLVAKAFSAGSDGVRIRYGNFWTVDLGEADVVFCYLFPDLMERLSIKLAGELRHGARVVSCNFPLSGWKPTRIIHPTPRRHGDPIYLYRFPDSRPETDSDCV